MRIETTIGRQLEGREVEFIDRIIVACAHGLGHVGMFLVTLWVRLIFVVICLAVIGVLGLVGAWAFR
nr:hypothetical protein [uncultured bacterium]